MLKGHSKIELFDAKSGRRVHVQEKDNMVTNALNKFYNQNPDNMFTRTNRNDAYYPICPNSLGGILLFPNALTEDVNNIYAPSTNYPIGYSSNDVNSTADTLRGSMNQTESVKIDNGYKFVFDFTTSQANGTISALALTNYNAGKGYYSSTLDGTHGLKYLCGMGTSWTPSIGTGNTFDYTSCAVKCDFENNYIYGVIPNGTTLKVYKCKANLTNQHLIISSIPYITKPEEETTLSSLAKSYNSFIDSGDGYIYGFIHDTNESGDAVVYYIKIKISDYTYTEGSWTFSGIHLYKFGAYGRTSDTSAYISAYNNYCMIRNGYLYAMSCGYYSDINNYRSRTIYKINLSNPADIKAIDITSFDVSYIYESMYLINGMIIIGTKLMIDGNDNVYRFGVNWSNDCGTYGNNLRLFANGLYAIGFKLFYSYGTNYYEDVYLISPYLATINNITPVTKTADKTMKITYTVTES